VILTGSIASIEGFPSFSVYNVSKAAVCSFVRSRIVDLKGRDIRIIATPGYQVCDYASRVLLFGVKRVWRLRRL
jgi:NADP-dependent 3-hydroxy acid dehydrogenase YdfG